MSDELILHHYERSPYAEKVRLMFGLSNSRWQSVLSPPWPPRPNIDPLSGGYRRIPIAQCGADIYCDSAVIAQFLAERTGCEALAPTSLDDEAKALMALAEGEAFFSAIGSVSTPRLLATLLLGFGPRGMVTFIKDRGELMKGGAARPARGARAKAVFAALLEAIDGRLQHQDWLGGQQPSLVDLAVYHPLWLHSNVSRRALSAPPAVQSWYGQMALIGHGQREEISPSQAFAAAREAEPAALPASVAELPVALGTPVSVAPQDYGVVPVTGELVAVSEQRLVIARDTADFGRVHVHFPRRGYAITPQ